MKALRSSAFFHPLGLALLAASILLAAVARAVPAPDTMAGRAFWLLAVGVLAYLATVVVVLRTSSRPRPAPARPESEPLVSVNLTAREVEVLRLIASGFTAKEIASELCVEESTVRRHTQNIYDKIDAQNIADATRWYIAHFGFPKSPRDPRQATPGPESREKRIK